MLEVGAGAVGPVAEGGLVAGHEDVLQFMHDFGVDMTHVHVERRAIALELFLVGALNLVVAHAVFPHGVVLAHETFADGADFVSARAVDAVHAGAAVALGLHGGALIGVEFGDGGAGVIAEHHARTRVVGVHPHVVGVVRGVVVAAGGRAALSGHHGLGADDDVLAGGHVPADGAAGLASVGKDLHGHDAVKDMDAGVANDACHDALDGHAVGNVNPPRAGLTEALGALVGSVGVLAELHAAVFEALQHVVHVIVPAVDDHGGGIAGQRLGVELHEIVCGVERRAFFVQDGHVVVVAATNTARTFQLAFIQQHDIQTLLAGSEGRAAAGRARADDKHVRFDQRAKRMS